MRISIITVVLNDRPGFIRTRDSVVSQSYTDTEWLVVDGVSKDGTLDEIKACAGHISRWVSEKDSGIYDAMNKGCSLASGDYVIFLNAGDIFFSKDSLSEAVAFLKQHPCDVLYAGGNYEFASGKQRYRGPKAYAGSVQHTLPAMHQATFYGRKVLPVPAYDLAYKISGDYYLAAFLHQRGARAGFLDRPVVSFMTGGTSMKRANRSLAEYWKVQRDVLGLGLLWRLYSGARRALNQRIMILLDSLNKGSR